MNGNIEKKLDHSVWMVCGMYALGGIVWILISDWLLATLAGPKQITQWQSWKGILFIAFNTGFLYILISRKNGSIRRLFDILRKQMRHFQATFEQAAVGIVHISTDEKWIRVNQTVCNLLEYDSRAFKSLTLMDIVHPDDLQKGREMDQKLIEGQLNSYVMEKRYIKKSGAIAHTRLTKSVVRNDVGELDYMIAIIEQIDAQKEAELKLKQSLREKDQLLAEIHHRVKNNLAVISGLMELQVYNLEHEQTRLILKESLMRIKSMALIHESYYEKGTLAHVTVNVYLHVFVNYIKTVYSDNENGIQIRLDADPLKLNINQALPCGLLLSEFLIYICRKDHELPGRVLDIVLRAQQENISIQVSGSFDFLTDDSLGMTIINALISQLDATLDIERDADITRFSIAFQRDKLNKGSSNAFLNVAAD